MSKKFTLALFVLSLSTLAVLPASAQLHNAVSLNGGFLNSSGAQVLPVAGTNGTIEFWSYVPTAETGTRYLISQGPDFYIGYKNGTITNEITLGANWDGTGVRLPIGQWNHIAVVITSSGSNADLYLNGKLVASVTDGSFSTSNPNTGELLVGTDFTQTATANAVVDGLRVWNIPRTGAEIRSFMFSTVPSNTAGLTAFYNMDEGTGTTAANSSSTSGIDLLFNGSPGWVNGPAIGANNALVFDAAAGSGTEAVAPSSTNFDFNSGTIEADIRPDNNNFRTAFVANRGGGNSRWSFHLTNSGGVNQILLYQSTDALGWVDYTPGFTIGQWYHISAVTAPNISTGKDSTGVYVNGDYVGQMIAQISGGSMGYGTGVTAQNITIGANGEGGEQFTGAIDEVRLWNAPLTQAQIVANMGTRLNGSEPNLVGLWSFDQGIADGDNTGLTMALEKIEGASAILNSSFSLNGAGTNYTQHLLTPLPVSFGKFTVTRQGSSALLKWQTFMESNSQDFIIQRSGSGTDFNDIGTTPAAGESRTVLNYTFTDNDPQEGTNYYRILERDKDLKGHYSIIQTLGFTKAGGLVWYSTGSAAVEVRLQKGSTEFYSITDVSGNAIRTGRLVDGRTTLTGVSGGIYFVKVRNAAGADLVTKVMLP